MPSPTVGKFSWSTNLITMPPASASATKVVARPIVTERALTILRMRRSTNDWCLPGLITLSGMATEFNRRPALPSPERRHAATRADEIRTSAHAAPEQKFSTMRRLRAGTDAQRSTRLRPPARRVAPLPAPVADTTVHPRFLLYASRQELVKVQDSPAA